MGESMADDTRDNTTKERFTADEGELEERRLNVQRLRVRYRLSVKKIAERLDVSEATVCRDMQWIREHWREQFGAKPKIDPADVVGEALAIYQEIEQSALQDAANCIRRTDDGELVDMVFFAKQRAACYAVALKAREAQVALLQDLGVVDRAVGTLDVTLPTAAQIRAAIDAAKKEAAFTDLTVPTPHPPPRPS